MPKVTVLMPVYNGMPYLIEAIDSILNQTLKRFTFLIINDGSTDETVQHLNHLDDTRLLIVHQPNRGLGATLNRGIAMCKTEFIARMDADDVALPGRLEAQLNFLGCHKEVGLVGTQYTHLSTGGRNGFPSHLPCEYEAIYTALFRGRHAICHPSIMCRKSLLKSIGGYRVEGIGEDWDMFLRMGEAAQLANLKEVLLRYRLNSASVSVKQLLDVRMRVNHACHCAAQRAEGLPEISFDTFVAEQHRRSFLQRAGNAMDTYALAQYRHALAEILGSPRILGYARLAWSAMCAPRRTLHRMYRTIRS
ncbi:MAG: glycosyltransferase [Deltaproteobacteria bacterium]|nr:glycosyltransferase [Deltaproteobacteria bacterium]